ncbi:protein TEX261 isoform X1 [Patagioenas fasciata]|uniref:protein TEX261 isoform X1 n=1 Tax=Patagioenas fasciata TaxID=372321 RepID=UPI003A9A1819
MLGASRPGMGTGDQRSPGPPSCPQACPPPAAVTPPSRLQPEREVAPATPNPGEWEARGLITSLGAVAPGRWSIPVGSAQLTATAVPPAPGAAGQREPWEGRTTGAWATRALFVCPSSRPASSSGSRTPLCFQRLRLCSSGRTVLPGGADRGVHGCHQEDHQIHDLVLLGRAGRSLPLRALSRFHGGRGALHQPGLLRFAPDLPLHRPHLLQLHPVLRAGYIQPLLGVPVLRRGILRVLRGSRLLHVLPVVDSVCVLRVAVGGGERAALHRAARRRRRLQLLHQGEARQALRHPPHLLLHQGGHPAQPAEDLLSPAARRERDRPKLCWGASPAPPEPPPWLRKGFHPDHTNRAATGGVGSAGRTHGAGLWLYMDPRDRARRILAPAEREQGPVPRCCPPPGKAAGVEAGACARCGFGGLFPWRGRRRA